MSVAPAPKPSPIDRASPFHFESQPVRDDRYAPRHIFEDILRYTVIPTIDLIVSGPCGVLLLRRTIAPYRNMWAIPGLRLLKGEMIEDCIARIAREELGLHSGQFSEATFVSQHSVKFKSEQNRQDLASAYAVKTVAESFVLNADHYSAARFVSNIDKLPASTGRLYRTELENWFSDKLG